jgi:very-short-patch-repair endonuclease
MMFLIYKLKLLVMILSHYVKTKISHNLIKYYRELNYDVNTKDYFNISVNDLPSKSGQKIEVKCDFCNKIKTISLYRYNVNTKNGECKYACSRKCAEEKNKKTVLLKYGVDNISKLEEIKNKKINTCIKNNNVKFPQQSNIIFNKSKLKKKLKYNNENYNNPNKTKRTNLVKYGFTSASMNENVKRKTKKSQFDYFKIQIMKNYKDLNIKNYDIDDKYILKCDNGCNHDFKIHYKLIWHRLKSKTILCTVCNPISKNISGLEIQLSTFLKNNYSGIILFNDRNIIKPYELDIYLPELKLAFEFDGLYWHNELNKDSNYHKMKTDLCENKGMQLIHIYEDDWLYKQDIIKSIILNKLGKTENKISVIKTEIREISDNNLIRDFLNNNHLQGFIGSKIKIGLFYKNELVSLMIFGKLKIKINSKSENKYELLRFCNKLNTDVVDSTSKLFNFFLKKYNPKQTISYSDRSYSNDNLYKQLGFTLDNITKPNYYYIIDGIRMSHFNFRKNILINDGYDSNKTEHEIMLERNIYRIYDSGNFKFTLTI